VKFMCLLGVIQYNKFLGLGQESEGVNIS